MTDRKNDFIKEFNALLKKYQVTLEAREGASGYDVWVDGIDVDFDYIPNGDNPAPIECGRYLNEIETEV